MRRTAVVVRGTKGAWIRRRITRGLLVAAGVLSFGTVVSALAVGEEAFAQGRPRAAAKASGKAAPSKDDVARAKAIEAQIRSMKPEEVAAGFQQLAAGGAAAQLAVPAAMARLASGLPAGLAVTALKSLASVGAETSSASIAPYLRHRDAAVRRAAAQALAKTRGAAAATALRGALSDSDAMVRGLAASGLGAIGAREAIDDLFVALDHKVPEAAASIGQLCTGAQCERFASKTGQIGFDVMTSGFEQILFRDPAEISDELKINIVGRVREVGTAQAHAFLKDVQGRWPASWSKRVKQALDLAVSSTEGAPGARREPTESRP